MRNEQLFDKIAARIEESPHLYNQQVWGMATDCGTAHCVAGWAVELAGDQEWKNDFRSSGGVLLYLSGPQTTSEAAQELLGLDEIEAGHLFASTWMEGRADEVPDRLRAIGRGASVIDDGQPS